MWVRQRLLTGAMHFSHAMVNVSRKYAGLREAEEGQIRD